MSHILDISALSCWKSILDLYIFLSCWKEAILCFFFPYIDMSVSHCISMILPSQEKFLPLLTHCHWLHLDACDGLALSFCMFSSIFINMLATIFVFCISWSLWESDSVSSVKFVFSSCIHCHQVDFIYPFTIIISVMHFRCFLFNTK